MIGDITSIGGGGGATASSSLGGLDSESFLKLLVAQLRYQNPLSPGDPSSMLQQTAQFTQIETLQQVAGLQRQQLGLSHAAVSAGLIGKTVTAAGSDGIPVEGVVEAVRFSREGPVLVIEDGTEIRLDATVELRRAS